MYRYYAFSVAILMVLSSAGSANTVKEAAEESGIRACLNAITLVSDMHLEDSQHTSHDYWATNRTDSAMFSSLVVKSYTDGGSHISIVASPRGDVCDIQWTESYAQEQRCSVVRETLFPNFVFVSEMAAGTIRLDTEDGQLSAYLTPSESGRACTVTRRELILGASG